MIEDSLSIVALLISSLITLVASVLLTWNFLAYKKPHHLLWAISLIFFALFGFVLIYYDFSIISEPIIPSLTTFIPVFLSVGIIYAVWGKNEYVSLFTLYESITLMIVILVEFFSTSTMTLFFLEIPESSIHNTAILLAHVPAGLVMFLVPIYAYITNKIDISGLLFSIGTAFVGIIGLMFTLIAMNSTIVSYDDIFTMIPLAYVLTAVFLALGMKIPEKWSFEFSPRVLPTH